MKKNFYLILAFLIFLITQNKLLFCMQNNFDAICQNDVFLNKILSQISLSIDDVYNLSKTNKKIREILKNAPLKIDLTDYKYLLTNDILEKICKQFNNIQELILSLHESPQINLKAIIKFQHLKILKLIDIKSKILDLTPLIKYNQLEYLSIINCKNFSNLDPLIHCEKLKELKINFCKNITNISALIYCKNLKKLCITNCERICQEQIESLQEILPNLEITYKPYSSDKSCG